MENKDKSETYPCKDYLVIYANGDVEVYHSSGHLRALLLEIYRDCAGSSNKIFLKAIKGFDLFDIDMIELFNELSCVKILDIYAIDEHVYERDK